MSNTNNFDSPDDLDQGIDQDMDFEDFDSSKDKSLKSSMKNSPLFKFGLVAIVIFVVIGVISLFGGSDVEAPQSFVGKGEENFKEAPGTKEVSPVMKEALEERNQQRVVEAQQTGTSAIPTPITPPKDLLESTQEVTESEDPLLRWQQMQEERARAQREQQLLQDQQTQTDPERENRLQGMTTAMAQHMGNIMGELKPPTFQNMQVFTAIEVGEGQGGEFTGGGTGIDPTGIVSPVDTKPATVIVPAGKVEYAQMMLQANSDIPGPVVAVVASGQFSGAKLLGKFTSEEEYLVITFNTLVTKKGTSIPVNAYALDPNTSLTGVATDVDHRYFRRIVLPAAAKFVEGLGEAYAETTTTTSQSSTSTTTSSEDLDTKQEFGKAVSEAAGTVAEILGEDGSDLQPLVVVAAGTPLGILFMESITDKTILQARAGYGGAQGGAGQYGQQQGVQGNVLYNQGSGQVGFNPLQQLQYQLQNQQFLQQNIGSYNQPSDASSNNVGTGQ